MSINSINKITLLDSGFGRACMVIVTTKTIKNCFIKTGLWKLSIPMDEQDENSQDETLEVKHLLKNSCRFTQEEVTKTTDRLIICDENCVTIVHRTMRQTFLFKL